MVTTFIHCWGRSSWQPADEYPAVDTSRADRRAQTFESGGSKAFEWPGPVSLTRWRPPRCSHTTIATVTCGFVRGQRRDEIPAAGLTFSERQHDQFREAHNDGKLIYALCTAMEN